MADYLLEIDAKVDALLGNLNTISTKVNALTSRPKTVTINLAGNVTTKLGQVESSLERITNSLRAIKEFRLPVISLGGVASPTIKIEATFDAKTLEKGIKNAQRRASKNSVEVEVDYDTKSDAARAAREAVRDINAALANAKAQIKTELLPPVDIKSEVDKIINKIGGLKANIKVGLDLSGLDKEITEVSQKINDQLINNAGKTLSLPINEKRLTSIKQSLGEIPQLLDNLAAARQRYRDVGKTTSVGITDLGRTARKNLETEAQRYLDLAAAIRKAFDTGESKIVVKYDNSDLERVKNEFNEWAASNKIVYFEFRPKNNPGDFVGTTGGSPAGGGGGGSSFVSGAAISNEVARNLEEAIGAFADKAASNLADSIGQRLGQRLSAPMGSDDYLTVDALRKLLREAGRTGLGSANRGTLVAQAKTLTNEELQRAVDRGIKLQLGNDGGGKDIAAQNAEVFLKAFGKAFMDRTGEIAASNAQNFLKAFKGAFIDPGTTQVVEETSRRFLASFLQAFVVNPEIASKQFPRIGDFNYQFPRNIEPASRETPNFNQLLDRMAAQTTMVAEASRMLRMLPNQMITTDLVGKANIQSELLSSPEIRQSIPAGRDILFIEIKKLFTEYFKRQNTTNPWVGNASGTPLLDRIMSATSESRRSVPLLPGAGQTSSAVGPLNWTTSYEFTKAQKQFIEVVKQQFAERRQPALPGVGGTSGGGGSLMLGGGSPGGALTGRINDIMKVKIVDVSIPQVRGIFNTSRSTAFTGQPEGRFNMSQPPRQPYQSPTGTPLLGPAGLPGVRVGAEPADSFGARQRGNADWLKTAFAAANKAAQDFSRAATPASSSLTTFGNATNRASQAASGFASNVGGAGFGGPGGPGGPGATGGLGGPGGGSGGGPGGGGGGPGSGLGAPGGGSGGGGSAGLSGPGGGPTGFTNLLTLSIANQDLAAARARAERSALAASTVFRSGSGQPTQVLNQILSSTRQAFQDLARTTRIQAEAQRIYTSNLQASTELLNDQIAQSRIGTTTNTSPLIRNGIQVGTVPVTSTYYPDEIGQGFFNATRVDNEPGGNRIFQGNMVRRTRANMTIGGRRTEQRIEELFEREALGRELEELISQQPITSRRTGMNRLRTARRERVGRLASESLIGGGFPLLFGAGPTSALGGGLGGLLGGMAMPGGGFAGSIIGSFAGQQVDNIATNAGNLAGSLKDPTETLTALEQSGFRVSDSLKFLVSELEALGMGAEAQAITLQEVEKRLGSGSVQELNALSGEQKRLQEAWSALSGELQRNLIPAIIGFTIVLNDIVGVLTALRNFNADENGNAVNRRLNPFTGEFTKIESKQADDGTRFNPFTGKRFDTLQKRIQDTINGASPLGPEATETKAFTDAKTRIEEERRQADFILSTKKESLQLTREAYDLVEREADIQKSIGNLRLQWEKDIYEIRKRATDEEFKAVDARARVGIEQVRTNLLGASVGKSDEEQRILGALSEYLSQREEGELAIEEKRRQVRVAVADLDMQVAEFSVTAAQQVETIERQINAYNRSVEDYKMKVAEYQLKVQRQIEDSILRSVAAQIAAAQAGMNGVFNGGAAGGRTGGALNQDPRTRGRSDGPHLHGEIRDAAGNLINSTVDQMLNAIDAAVTFEGGKKARDFIMTRGGAGHSYPGGGTAIDLAIPQGTGFSLNPGYTGADLGVIGAYGQTMGVRGPALGSNELRLAHLLQVMAGGGGMGAAGAGGSSMLDGYFRRLSYLESEGRWQTNPDNPDVQGYFQAKTPFRQEAMQASGGLDVRSRDYGEASRAAQAWVKKHRPEAYEAIMRGDIPTADRILGPTWTALPTGAEPQNARKQAEGMRLLAAASPSSFAQQISNVQFPDMPSYSKIPLGETPDPSQVLAQYRESSEKIKASLADQLGSEEKINSLLQQQNASRFKAAIIGTSQEKALKAENDLQQMKVDYLTDINNLGVSEEERSRRFLAFETQVQKDQLKDLRTFALEQAQKSGAKPEAIEAAIKLTNEAFDEKENQNALVNEQRLRALVLAIQEKQAEKIDQYVAGLMESTNEAQLLADAYANGSFQLSAQDQAAVELGEAWKGAKEETREYIISLIEGERLTMAMAENMKQLADITLQTKSTGLGLRAGFIGESGSAFESTFMDRIQAGDTEEAALDQAYAVAEATELYEEQRAVWDNLQKDILAVSDAIAGSLTNGLADIILGARSIKDVGREVLESIGRSFLDSAQDQLGLMVQRQIMSMFGGADGALGSLFSAAGPASLGSASTVAATQITTLGVSAASTAGMFQAMMLQLGASSAASGGGALGGIFSVLGTVAGAIPGGAAAGAVSGGATGIGGAIDMLPGLANGGGMQAGEARWTGERGPELFIPGISGTVISAEDTQEAVAESLGLMGGGEDAEGSYGSSDGLDGEYGTRESVSRMFSNISSKASKAEIMRELSQARSTSASAVANMKSNQTSIEREASLERIVGEAGSVQVSYSGPVLRFDSEDYVKKSDVPRIINEGAKKGKALVAKSVKNDPAYKRALG